MAQCIFTTNSISGTNIDKKRGNTITGVFSHTGGELPPMGSTLQSASIHFSNIKVYTSRNPGFSTAYGGVALSEDTSQTCALTNPASSLINFTGGGITFTVTGGGSSTSNVLNVREGSYISITLNYATSAQSTGTLNTTSVNQGGAITLTVSPSSSSYTHKVVWKRDDSHKQERTLAVGMTQDIFTVPSSWPIGSATVLLETYFNGNRVGQGLSYSFSINVDPTKVIPTAGAISVALKQSPYVPSSWGLYVKGYSKAVLTLAGSSPGNQAQYKSVSLGVGSQTQNTTNTKTFTTAALQETGFIDCIAAVTNSYNNSASAVTKQISVHEYTEPIFLLVSAFRCHSNGTPSDTGAYFGVNVKASIASVNGKNRLLVLQARYAVQGTTAWSTAKNVTNNGVTIIGGNATGANKYQVQVIAIDDIQNLRGTNSSAIVTALTSEHVIYCMDGGLNVSFGKTGTRQNAVEINPAWGLWHGDYEVTGTTSIARGGTGATTVAGARNALKLGNTSGALPVANGGTGATTVANARNALGLGKTSGALPVANGGTGANNATNARANLGITPGNIGAAPSAHNHSANNITSGTLDPARMPFKVARGSVSIYGVSWASVSFSGFLGTPTIVVSYAGNASSSSIKPLKTQNESAWGFEVCMAGSSGSGYRTVNWIAIGT